MAKKKSHPRKTNQPVRPFFIQQGLKFFKEGDYDRAIYAWEMQRAQSLSYPNLTNALAEAHFRRAVQQTATAVADLTKAVELAPAEPLYRYHLALVQHRLGKYKPAETLYRQLLAQSPPFERAALPLAQLLVANKKAVTNDPVWQMLSPQVKARFEAAEATITNKKAVRLDNDDVAPIWQGMIALAANDLAQAQKHLERAATTHEPVNNLDQAMAHYYLGVLAAADNQLDAALTHWQTAQNAGLNTPQLRQNLSVVLYPQLAAKRDAGQLDQALQMCSQISLASMVDSPLANLYRQLNWEQGYALALKGNWTKALGYFQVAQQTGDDSRALLLNLALTYQKCEHHFEAAEHWRQLLRRRPRKADHSDALTDEQVARIWQNIAENYALGEDYEEAVKTYKNAVKWAPDNIDLRLKLVDALQTGGSWKAAENELNRILQKEPDHIQAMLMLAESYSTDYFGRFSARKLLQRVLELEPQNPIGRQQLALMYAEDGMQSASWGDKKKAIKTFEEGLKQIPDSQRLLVLLGSTYAETNKMKQAQRYLKEAIEVNPADLQTLHSVFMVWLEYAAAAELLWVFDKIKAVPGVIPSPFFMVLISHALQYDQADWAIQLLEYTETKYADDAKVMTEVATFYVDLEQEKKAVAILRQIIKENPTHAAANLRLGSIYYEMDQKRLAHKHWDIAETQARKDNDQMVLYDLKMAKDILVHGKTPPKNMLEFLRDMPPELKAQMIGQMPPEIANILESMGPDMLELMMGMGLDFDDDYDDEDDDDDDF